jgi:cytochrome c-type biogenesis protein CcsB
VPTTSTMLADVSDNLVYSAIAVYALAMLTYAALAARGTRTAVPEPAAATVLAGSPSSASPIDAVTPHSPATGWDQTARVGASLTVLAFLLHAAGVVARGIAAGRAPWGNMYEFALVGSLAAAGAFLVFLRRHPVSPLGVWLLAIVLLALGLGVTVLYAPAGDLIPVLDSYWLVIHVAAAIVAGGTFTVGAVATVAFLVAERTERRSTDDADARRTHRRLPPASSLSDISHAAHLFAFPIWTFAVIAGAIWAENSWGRYWGWDPKETWAFITFVFYAAHLHAESTAGWRGRRAAYLALLGYAAFLFNFFGVNMWISGLHSYAGV